MDTLMSITTIILDIAIEQLNNVVEALENGKSLDDVSFNYIGFLHLQVSFVKNYYVNKN
jgi:hypothetical protein